MTTDEIIKTMQSIADAVAMPFENITKSGESIGFSNGNKLAGVRIAPSAESGRWFIQWSDPSLIWYHLRSGTPYPTVGDTEELIEWGNKEFCHMFQMVWAGRFTTFSLFPDRLRIQVGHQQNELNFPNRPVSEPLVIRGHQDMARAFARDDISVNMFMEYIAERVPTEWAKLGGILA